MDTVDWKTFNYWAPEHYAIVEFKGTLEECREAFLREQEKYPPMQYATSIAEDNFNEDVDEHYVIIKRFKTRELLRIHHDYPVTYIREGKVL